MAQQFAQFFNDKVIRIRDEIHHNQGPGSPDEQIGVNPPDIDFFAPVSEEEMRKIILNSNSKYCTFGSHPNFVSHKLLGHASSNNMPYSQLISLDFMRTR